MYEFRPFSFLWLPYGQAEETFSTLSTTAGEMSPTVRDREN